MIYQMIRNLILSGKTAGLETKIEVFYSAGKLTKVEYNKLMAML